MASSPCPNLQKNKKKHESKVAMTPQQGGTTPHLFEPDELAQNLSPLIDHSPNQPPSTLWRRWSPFRQSPSANSPSFRSVLHSFVPSCKSPKLPRPSLLSRGCRRRRVTGTLFGLRKGRATFAVQVEPENEPSLLLELAFSTSFLIDVMAAGVVRILLECEKAHVGAKGTTKMVALWEEPVWTMYSNGLQCGFAVTRPFNDEDRRIFHTVGAISAGAGVLPAGSLVSKVSNPDVPQIGCGGGGHDCAIDVMFMRAKFERVVGSRDSEAFYMTSPGGRGGGGSELSVFLLRV